jgi:hypothetical protein
VLGSAKHPTHRAFAHAWLKLNAHLLTPLGSLIQAPVAKYHVSFSRIASKQKQMVGLEVFAIDSL